MPVKIRLSRHGRKRKPLYHIVVADSRAPRDGRFIDNLGSYNPNTNPATIELDFDKAFDWVQKGAQPTDTCRAILSYKGVLMKKHLVEGAKKGAFSEEDAEKKFEEWLKQKEAKIQSKIDSLSMKMTESRKEKLAREAEVNEARAAELVKKQEKLAAATKASNATESEEEVENEVPQPEVVTEATPVAEDSVETLEPATEVPEAENATEAASVAEETVETPEAETKVPEVENATEDIESAEETPETVAKETTEETTEESTESESTKEDTEEK